ARPVRCKCISDALRTLKSLEQRIGKGVQSIDTLRGLEGAAQAAYFRAYTTLFPPSLDFHRRNRRPPRDPVNACLSLAYTLTHFEAVRIAYIVGLDPFLGFFHEIAFGRESLACDLIEPIRPSIDRWVWDLFRSRILRTEHFRSDKNACVLGKAGRSHFYKHFDPLLRDTASALGGYCRLLVKALRSKSPELPVADGEFEP
ncbi:MAG TPA: CRISPR-associated endonuclease Cas1, partial [Acidobacteriota bacterium]|nr:CRISPR-associated endonuclease Cas1 [Acidobacteriota bacterium]